MKTVEITYRYQDDAETTRERPTDAEAALQRMNDGNRAFAELFNNQNEQAGPTRHVLHIDPCDLGLRADGAEPRQLPFAAVLGCSDARVPIGHIFNEGPNELFGVRVVGNTLGSDVRGSLNYALEHLGESLKLVVVLGHSDCGAVTAAVEVFLDPTGYLALVSKHAMRMLVDRLQVVVHAASQHLETACGPDVRQHPKYREALIELSVVTNAALAAHTLQREIGSGEFNEVRVVYGIYLLKERKVWAPRCGSDEVDGLAAPPADTEAFGEFSNAVLRSQRIVTLLSS